MIESIPLSWFRSDRRTPQFESVGLPLSGLKWVYSADVPVSLSFEGLYEKLLDEFGKAFLMRGCRADIARYLTGKGFEAVRTGAEGVIDLTAVNGFRPSVRELARRGLRRGEVREVPFNDMNQRRVSELSRRTSYGRKPRFHHLFRGGFADSTRCFVFADTEDRWHGALTVSATTDSSAHAELILRDKDAPPGVMEALIAGVTDTLRGKGCESFSLGEVPFITPVSIESGISSRSSALEEKTLFQSGRMLRFAFDYAGLFHFKNKFDPVWRPIYICASPAVSYSALADLFFMSRFFELSRRELASAIRKAPPVILRKLSNPFSAHA